MKNKLLNKIQRALVIIFLLSLNIDMCSNYYYLYGVYNETVTENFYDKAFSDYADFGVVFGSIIVISCILIIYICVAESYRFKNKTVPKIFSFSEKLVIKNKFPIIYFLPAVCILCLILYAILIYGDHVGVSYIEYYYEYFNGAIVIPLTILGIMIAVCVLDFLYSKKINQTADVTEVSENSAPETPVPVVDYTDELIKLKNLLDMGAITQEEFDAKKKQLLGL